ncbi:MAG: glycoside hydrolase family 43 protein [Pseudomonadota bacterium]
MRLTVMSVFALALTGCGKDLPTPDSPADELYVDATSFSNPIIAGFAPDPSLVRVGEDFYLVNSSFEYFPGLPIYHSRDLVNWSLIGYALANPVTAYLDDVDASGGIHAATIRYDDGVFYVVTTNIVHERPVSFIVTARNPAGPWSDPVVVEDAEGIDPSLFFDDDGRVWYHANRTKEEPSFPGEAEIWLQELDRDTLQLIGPRSVLWSGCCQGVWAEGPHIYKRDGTYYLLISEGGTSYKHAIAVAIADDVQGPYQNNPRNPILTHRHLSLDYPITGVGHADLVELADGRWYAVALGWRLMERQHGLLGRETFLLPVTWETDREWWVDPKRTYPVFSPTSGRVDLEYPLPFADQRQRATAGFVDEFDGATLKLEWNMRRSHSQPFHALADGKLVLDLQAQAIANRAQYSFLGVRQRDFAFLAETAMQFEPKSTGEEAGLMIVQKDAAAFGLTVRGGDDSHEAVLWQTLYGERTDIAVQPIASATTVLRVEGDGTTYRFYAGSSDSMAQMGGDIDAAPVLSPNVLRGFNYTGVYVGVYGSSNGAVTTSQARFERFVYSPEPPSNGDWFTWGEDK